MKDKYKEYKYYIFFVIFVTILIIATLVKPSGVTTNIESELKNELKLVEKKQKELLETKYESYKKLLDNNHISYLINEDDSLNNKVDILKSTYDYKINSFENELIKYKSKVDISTLKNENIEIEYKNYTQAVANSKKAYEKNIAEEKAKQKALEEQKVSTYVEPSYKAPSTSNGANNNYIPPKVTETKPIAPKVTETKPVAPKVTETKPSFNCLYSFSTLDQAKAKSLDLAKTGVASSVGEGYKLNGNYCVVTY